MGKNKYNFGAIWVIPDKKIKFPKNLFRTEHKNRTVVIVENSKYNNNKNETDILVIPLSSQLSIYHPDDILIKKDDSNKLDKDCYARMRAIQFINKSSCIKYIGKVSDEIKCDILYTIQSYINNGQVN